MLKRRRAPSSRTLGALLDEMAAARPGAEAVVTRGERLTYGALRDRADAGAIAEPNQSAETFRTE